MINLTTGIPMPKDAEDLASLRVALRLMSNNFKSISSIYGSGVGVDQLNGKIFEKEGSATGYDVYNNGQVYIHDIDFTLGHDFNASPSGYVILKQSFTLAGGQLILSTGWEIVSEDSKNTVFRVKCLSNSVSSITCRATIFAMR